MLFCVASCNFLSLVAKLFLLNDFTAAHKLLHQYVGKKKYASTVIVTGFCQEPSVKSGSIFTYRY